MPEGRAPMYSGRLESDNGLGPNQLLGTDQVTMDYIYGVALHEDDERRARLENVDEESIPLAEILQLDSLLHVIHKCPPPGGARPREWLLQTGLITH